MSDKWSGAVVRNARAYWLPKLPVPCSRCKRPVIHDERKRAGGWHVGHVIDRWMGGPDDISNTWPEHDHCNMSAGGKVGAAMTNRAHEGRRELAKVTMIPERTRRIRGR